MGAALALRLLLSVLLASRSTCALLGGCPRRTAALGHRRSVQLSAVELEPSDTTQLGGLPSLGEVTQDLAADQIVPDVWDPDSTPADGPGSFVEIFRSSTPYIKMHRASTMVVHLDTRVLDEERLLADLMDDVALITVLGVMPVLVISIRDQVDARLREMGVEPRFHGMHIQSLAFTACGTFPLQPAPRQRVEARPRAPPSSLLCRPRPSQARCASRTLR